MKIGITSAFYLPASILAYYWSKLSTIKNKTVVYETFEGRDNDTWTKTTIQN